MRRSRIYTPQSLASPGSVELEASASHYLLRVLRLAPGDPVTLFNGDGWDYAGEVSEVQRRCIRVSINGSQIPNNESPLRITLVQAISRGDRMDYSLQKATELGVSDIQPVTSARVEVRLDDKRKSKRLAHWQGVVISACEQSGRAVLPQVHPPLTLFEWLSASSGSERLVLDPKANSSLSEITLTSKAVSILVGPEGGFSSTEIETIGAQDITAVSLGPRVLRTETAGPAAVCVLQARAGDL
jgi:16S rRNA (uracil1498-N3)-methyltransferase